MRQPVTQRLLVRLANRADMEAERGLNQSSAGFGGKEEFWV